MEHRNWAVQTGRLQSHNFLAFMNTGRILGRICASRRKTDQISHEMLIAQNNYYRCSPANYNWKQFRHLLFSIMLFIYLFIYLLLPLILPSYKGKEKVSHSSWAEFNKAARLSFTVRRSSFCQHLWSADTEYCFVFSRLLTSKKLNE